MNKSLVHGLEDLIVLRCQDYPKQPAESIQSPTKFKRCFFKNGKADPQIYMKFQGISNSQNNSEKEKQR